MAQVSNIDVVELTQALVDIESTSGNEGQVARWLAGWLRERGFAVDEQLVEDNRLNLYITVGDTDPDVVLSTHLDCVPPYFPSRIEANRLYGRGSCDAKGIAAAQVGALEQLREAGESRVGAVFVVGVARGSHGARAANLTPRGSRFLVNGEPTDSRLALATKGAYRVKLQAAGKAAHSAYPEQGESAIDKLVDALMALRAIPLPSHPTLGPTTCTIALIDGGVAPNVVPPHASAEATFRIVGPREEVRTAIEPLGQWVELEDIVEVPAVELTTVPGFDTTICAFTTDIPFLTAWGQPLLFGPGSILVAHTSEEHVPIDELRAAPSHYASIAKHLLTQ